MRRIILCIMTDYLQAFSKTKLLGHYKIDVLQIQERLRLLRDSLRIIDD